MEELAYAWKEYLSEYDREPSPDFEAGFEAGRFSAFVEAANMDDDELQKLRDEF